MGAGAQDAAPGGDAGELEQACLQAAASSMDVRSVRIDPDQERPEGFALVEGRSTNGRTVSVICAYDRTAKSASIGSPLVAASRASTPQRRVNLNVGAFAEAGFRPCDGGCQQTLDILTQEDGEALNELPQQVARTLADLRRGGMPSDSQTRLLFSLLDNGGLDMDFGAVASGSYSCELYLFGFLDQGARRVATHQCRIEREGAALRVRKTTGERLDGLLLDWKGRLKAFVGRSFRAGQEATPYDRERPDNAEDEVLGNYVGLALANDSTLYLVSIDQRGFATPDQSFFEVLKIGAR